MKTFKTTLFFINILITGVTSFAQHRTLVIEDKKIKCNYELKNGKITGDYTSFYKNGTKKSEGKLENGYRTGLWTVWDSTGRKRMERIYVNPFEYKRIFPEVSNEGPIPLLMEGKFKLKYDSNRIIKYRLLRAEDAVWRHKFWRYLKPEGNEILFKNKRLIELVKNLALSGQLQLFDTIDDRFITTIKEEFIANLLNYNNKELIGFELKEENIFDMGGLISEYRILGICPVVKTNNKIQKLFWVYYPDIRKYLAKEIIKNKINSPFIKSFDDLFVFRYFSSTIIKSTIDNPYDYFIKDYKGITAKGIANEQEQLELIIIEAENDIWISLTK